MNVNARIVVRRQQPGQPEWRTLIAHSPGVPPLQITDILAQMGGLKSMARELGVSDDQAESGAEALVPAILGGLKKQANSHPDGVEGLGGLLGQLGGGGLFDSVLSQEPTNVSQGNEVLGEIFGSKEVSRTVANDAAARSGLDPALLKKMLPILAMLVAGFMAKRGLGGVQQESTSMGGGLGDMLGGLFGGQSHPSGSAPTGGLGSMLDLNGDGNALDDIMRMAGKVMR